MAAFGGGGECAESGVDLRGVFVEEPIEDAETRIEVTKVEAGVYVVKPHVPQALTRQELDAVQQTLLDELFVEYEVDDYLLWVYSPMAATFAEHLEPVATVYDCMDELSLFAGAPPELLGDGCNGFPEFGCDGFWFSGCS